MLHHRHTLFPAVLGLISLLLVAFYIVYAKPSDAPPRLPGGDVSTTSAPIKENPPVSKEQYETHIHDAFVPFFSGVETATQAERNTLIDATLELMLQERVPSEYQMLHLDLVRYLHALKKTEGGSDASKAAYKELLRLRAETPWLP